MGFSLEENRASSKWLLEQLHSKFTGAHLIGVNRLQFMQDNAFAPTVSLLSQKIVAEHADRLLTAGPANFPADACAAFIDADVTHDNITMFLEQPGTTILVFAGLHRTAAAQQLAQRNTDLWTPDSRIPVNIYLQPTLLECLKGRIVSNVENRNGRRELGSEKFLMLRAVALELGADGAAVTSLSDRPLYHNERHWDDEKSRQLWTIWLALYPHMSECLKETDARRTLRLWAMLSLCPPGLTHQRFRHFIAKLEQGLIDLPMQSAALATDQHPAAELWTFKDCVKLACVGTGAARKAPDEIIWPSMQALIQRRLQEITWRQSYAHVSKSFPVEEAKYALYKNLYEFNIKRPGYGLATLKIPRTNSTRTHTIAQVIGTVPALARVYACRMTGEGRLLHRGGNVHLAESITPTVVMPTKMRLDSVRPRPAAMPFAIGKPNRPIKLPPLLTAIHTGGAPLFFRTCTKQPLNAVFSVPITAPCKRHLSSDEQVTGRGCESPDINLADWSEWKLDDMGGIPADRTKGHAVLAVERPMSVDSSPTHPGTDDNASTLGSSKLDEVIDENGAGGGQQLESTGQGQRSDAPIVRPTACVSQQNPVKDQATSTVASLSWRDEQTAIKMEIFSAGGPNHHVGAVLVKVKSVTRPEALLVRPYGTACREHSPCPKECALYGMVEVKLYGWMRSEQSDYDLVWVTYGVSKEAPSVRTDNIVWFSPADFRGSR